MINIILHVLGIILQVYAIILCSQINKKLGEKKLKSSWNFISVLIIFFLFGYCFHLYLIINHLTSIVYKDILISLIFFFGAIFVVTVVSISKKQIIMLNNDKKELESKNSELLVVSDRLKKEHAELEKAKSVLEIKNTNLKDDLDSFYTLKIEPNKKKKKVK